MKTVHHLMTAEIELLNCMVRGSDKRTEAKQEFALIEIDE